MQWKPDLDSTEPIFKQIMRHFEEEIISGELSPGDSIPSERGLADELGLNRSTISMAYDELRATGLIRSVRGSGTRVSEDLWGVIPSRIPNWNQYTSKGTFLPTLPLDRRIQEASNMPGIINLARSELSADLFPVSKFNHLLRDMSVTVPLGYSDPRGALNLRETLVSHLDEQYGIRVEPNQIMITSGAQQSMHLITQCLLAPGDSIGLEGPSYAYSLSLFTSAGLRLFRIPTDERGLQPDEVIRLHRKHRIRMLFINPTYQNPTGTTLTLERRKRLLEICSELRLPIVEDDAYSALTLDDKIEPPSALFSMEAGENVIYLGSMSKTVAPGMRIGWVVGPVSVIERLADAKQQMDLGTSAIAQQLAQTFLESGEWARNLMKLKKTLSVRRDRMIRALSCFVGEDATWTVPHGGYHLWCHTKSKTRDSEILEIGIRNKVLFVPGGLYGSERGYVKFSFARASSDEIEEGIHRFAKTLTLI